MKKDPMKILREQKVVLPNSAVYWFFHKVLELNTIFYDVSFKYDFDQNAMKGRQVILIADHSSRNAYKYVFAGYKYCFAKLNPVISVHNVLSKIFPLHMSQGTIPKIPFNTDIVAVRKMIKVIKMGGSLLLFPEGAQSLCGETLPVLKQTADLLKKLGVCVVLCSSKGAFFVQPDFATYERKGHQEYEYSILFEPEELAILSPDEIYERMMSRFSYNDNVWNETANWRYHEKHGLAEGIEKILYKCPKCEKEFTLKGEREKIVCKSCGNEVLLNDRYFFEKANDESVVLYKRIDIWHNYEKQKVLEELESEDFEISYECSLFKFHPDLIKTDPYVREGEGKLILNKQILCYEGVLDGKNVKLDFELKDVNSFNRIRIKSGNMVFYHKEFFCFCPTTDNGRSEKIRLAIKELNARANRK